MRREPKRLRPHVVAEVAERARPFRGAPQKLERGGVSLTGSTCAWTTPSASRVMASKRREKTATSGSS